MATTIKLKNSVTTTNAPSSLVQGEVAINITDKKVWVGNAATTPIQLLGDGGSASFTSIAFGAGTVSSPSITFTGDTNTGIYSPAADTIAFTEGGVESMRIDSSGNVGIGVTPNTWTLGKSVSVGDVGSAVFGFGGYNSLTSGAYFNSGWKYSSSSSSQKPALFVASDGAFTFSYAAAGTAGNAISFSEAMRIDSSGNVGINNTSPAVLASTTQVAIKANVNGNSLFVAQNSNGLTTAKFGFQYTGSVDNPVIGSSTNHPLVFLTNDLERMRITSGGYVGINTTNPTNHLQVNGGISSTSNSPNFQASAAIMDVSAGVARFNATGADNSTQGTLTFNTASANAGIFNERMRITSTGNICIGTTVAGSISGTGGSASIGAEGWGMFQRSGAVVLYVNRNTDDGNLVDFYQAGTLEGSISVSGTTVSYNGGHLARWSQLPNNQKDDTLLKGTVMSNLDDMCVWTKDGEVLPNEQLNKMKVSDVEGDTNVAGVFVSWTFDEQCQSDDMNVAMTGDMIIRIAEGVVVQKGDLLMSAGDGTAKPQGDDIVRSKTVAKVTSNHVTCTYADGSYCVPCVLMAC